MSRDPEVVKSMRKMRAVKLPSKYSWWEPPPISLVLRAFRMARGLSIWKAAKLSGVATNTLARLERSTSQYPRWDTVCAVARGLGVSLDELRAKELALIERLRKEGLVVGQGGRARILKARLAPVYRRWKTEGRDVSFRHLLTLYKQGILDKELADAGLEGPGGEVVGAGDGGPGSGGNSA